MLRLHDFSHGVIGQLRGSYQVIPNSKYIPYLDQFQTGGLATVRGYSEGICMGKNGYFFSGELMFPLLPRTITNKDGRVRNFVGQYVKVPYLLIQQVYSLGLNKTYMAEVTS